MYAASLRTRVVSHAILTVSVSFWFIYTVQFQPSLLWNGSYTHDNSIIDSLLFSYLPHLCGPRAPKRYSRGSWPILLLRTLRVSPHLHLKCWVPQDLIGIPFRCKFCLTFTNNCQCRLLQLENGSRKTNDILFKIRLTFTNNCKCKRIHSSSPTGKGVQKSYYFVLQF